MILQNLGLPPLPTNYDPFGGLGGLPPGFTENPNIGGGAPIFTAPGAVGPNWNPGGSIFGGRGLPIVPGSTVGPGNLGGGGMINFGGLPNSWTYSMLSPQMKALLTGALNRDATSRAQSTDHIAGGGGAGHNIRNVSTA